MLGDGAVRRGAAVDTCGAPMGSTLHDPNIYSNLRMLSEALWMAEERTPVLPPVVFTEWKGGVP